jgi:hypothetical protein
MREGKLDEAAFGKRMKGEGPYAWMIGRRFERAAERLGFAPGAKLRCDMFEPPRRGAEQLGLFDAFDLQSGTQAKRPARAA